MAFRAPRRRTPATAGQSIIAAPAREWGSGSRDWQSIQVICIARSLCSWRLPQFLIVERDGCYFERMKTDIEFQPMVHNVG